MSSIVFFHPSSELYGADKILAFIVKAHSDFSSKVLVLPSYGPLVDLLHNQFPDLQIIVEPRMPIVARKNLHPLGILRFARDLCCLYKLYNIAKKSDVLYFNTLAVLPVLLFFHTNSIKVLHVHEILDNSKILNRSLNKLALKYSDVIVCVSRAVLNNLSNVSSHRFITKLKLLHNGINFSDNNNVEEKSFVLKSDTLNFVLVGRIKPSHKGQLLVLKAISKLPQDILLKTHFYFVGSCVKGQEYMIDELENCISENKLNSFVTIFPFVKNIKTIYEQADVSLVPSLFEDPFPTTVLESMYFKKPVIGTKVGGIPEMVIDNVTGFLCEKEPDEIASKIIYFVNNPQAIAEMGEKGRSYFEKEFTDEAFYERFHVLQMKYNI